MNKKRKYTVRFLLLAGILSCKINLLAMAMPIHQEEMHSVTESADLGGGNLVFLPVATPGNSITMPEEEFEEEKSAEPVLMRQSRASNVLTITGSGTDEKMKGTQGKPGVYLLFQGAEYRHGFNQMVSTHSTEGTRRQLDGMWEYYKCNETKTIDDLKTEISKGPGNLQNYEMVKIADAMTIQNSTDTGTGKWNTVVTITNPHPKLTGVLFYYYAPHLADYGGVTIFPFGGQQKVNGAEEAHTHTGTKRTEPTCTAPGSITGKCEMCGTVNQTLPALGHVTPGSYDTASVPGYKVKNCSRCSSRLETVPNQYQIVYVGNGATGGNTPASGHQVGASFAIAGNGFSRTGYQFTLWNTQAAGTGIGYQVGQSVQNLTLKDRDTVQLFAQWKANGYQVRLNPDGGTCEKETLSVTYDAPYGQLPVPVKTDYQFKGWVPEGGQTVITAETLYQTAADTVLIAQWELHFEDLGNGTNRRPGEDGKMETEDDHYYYNGQDKNAGTEDDVVLEAGEDGVYRTKDDYYQNQNGQNVHCGSDKIFDTKDDYIDNGDGTNNRPGEDRKWDTKDDEKWHNGEDKIPGNEDDKLINPGLDGEYGTKDDFIDNGDGTNNRPGEDGKWDTKDDEKWHNGEDKVPGTEDDKLIKPGDGDNSGDGSGNNSGDNSGSGSGNNSGNGSGGNSGNSSGGGSGHTQGGPGVYGDAYTDVGKGKSGRWEKLPAGWVFHYTDGGKAKDEWCYLYYGVTGRTDWYRFGLDEYMKVGWHQDPDGSWYFLHTISDGTLGHMKTGWYLDIDGKWYYLNPVSDGHRGAMVTGWQLIDGKWYYFNPVSDGTKGAMYAGQVTPDGYMVGEDGARIE